ELKPEEKSGEDKAIDKEDLDESDRETIKTSGGSWIKTVEEFRKKLFERENIEMDVGQKKPP
ncbi:23757_t:CDS:2, partial [Gigaspora rosea]